MIATVSKNISSTDTLTAAVKPIRVLMAAGGTGGHVYPAIAIADALKKLHPKSEVHFVGTKERMEWETVPKYGYKISGIWISGIHRRLTIQNLLFPLKLVVSIIQSFFILRKFRPDAVVSCGGFASGPVGWVAAKRRIPLFLQEQNSYPGVTNRMLGKHAELIFTAFTDAANHFEQQKIRLLGNPVRSQLEPLPKDSALKEFGFDNQHPVLLVMGGSGGALAINEAMLAGIKELHDKAGLQIIWQCGDKYAEGIKKRLDVSQYPKLRLLTFIENMPAAYSAADLVVTRSGAGTCSELMNLGQPAVLVPSPNVAGDHQKKNASSLTQSGAAQLLPEEQLETDLSSTVTELINDSERLTRMKKAMLQLAKPNAADAIATEISTYLTEHHS